MTEMVLVPARSARCMPFMQVNIMAIGESQDGQERVHNERVCYYPSVWVHAGKHHIMLARGSQARSFSAAYASLGRLSTSVSSMSGTNLVSSSNVK